ncbi:MAG: sugar transferase [Bdellovibrionota bacterium]|nr:MAG: sugar transferase [Bdellovibrionota bacterium]
MKRILDILVSLVGLFLCGPVIAAIAATILIRSGRPILFRQRRIGLQGREFELLKFRTMTRGEGDATLTVHQDPRITREGIILRHWRLDELPQLVNVLKGEMTLVGPRPETPELARLYDQQALSRMLSVKPGVTGTSSIEFLDEGMILVNSRYPPEETYQRVIIPRKIQLIDEYIRTQSLVGDVKILFFTILRLIFRRGPSHL